MEQLREGKFTVKLIVLEEMVLLAANILRCFMRYLGVVLSSISLETHQ